MLRERHLREEERPEDRDCLAEEQQRPPAVRVTQPAEDEPTEQTEQITA